MKKKKNKPKLSIDQHPKHEVDKYGTYGINFTYSNEMEFKDKLDQKIIVILKTIKKEVAEDKHVDGFNYFILDIVAKSHKTNCFKIHFVMNIRGKEILRFSLRMKDHTFKGCKNQSSFFYTILSYFGKEKTQFDCCMSLLLLEAAVENYKK